SSAAISRSNRALRADPRRRRSRAKLGMLQDARDGRAHAFPARGFFRELPASRFGERVELRAAIVLGIAPRRLDPPLLLERIQRPLIDLQDVPRNLLETLRDPPAVHRARRERAQDEEIERALKEIAFGRHEALDCRDPEGSRYSSLLSHVCQALNSNGRPRKSRTSVAGGFEPPGASTVSRYLRATSAASRLLRSNWLKRSFAITSDHM